MRITGLVLASVLTVAASAFGQTAAPEDRSSPQAAPPATLVFANRSIVELRASILSRTPADRVAAATTVLNSIVAAEPTGPVVSRLVEGVAVVAVGATNAFVIVPDDVDVLAGETLEQKTALAVSQLQIAIDEEMELRSPARMAIGVAESLGMTLLLGVLLWLLRRGYRVLAVMIPEGAEKQLQRFSAVDLELVRASRAGDILRSLIAGLAVLMGLGLTYFWLTFVLRRFPYTRPWGESLREFLLTRFAALGLAVVAWMPDLFTIIVIVLFMRFIARLAYILFEAAAQDRIKLPGVYPETAQPTRRLVAMLLWLFTLVLIYPYLPGSDSDAFKGMSVFVGLIVSLGSSGIISQIMSGLTLTYSRALRLGDYAAIGDVEGTVTHLGSLSTKIKTARGEDVTIPNAVVVSTPMTNYSRFADDEAVLVPTTVTIGYDVPWRQIHALLLLAAERTPGIKRNPAPLVLQTDLRDFYVQYTLFVCIELPQLRIFTLGALRANVQDAFNEFGVQIMSPNYEADPSAPKVVPRERWYASPAAPVHQEEPVETR
jgi:small-conductance mechanosensitive channel